MARSPALLATALVLLATVSPAAAVGGASPSGSAYAGTHVAFDVQSNAITDYRVNDAAVFESVKVQSQSSAKDQGLVDVTASLSALTSLEGAVLSTKVRTSAAVKLSTGSSASVTVHDNGHGVLVVRANDEAQYVVANLSADASASASGDGEVTVTTADGTTGTFLVVGDGTVTVNENGDVSAKLSSNAKLVFRAYPAGKDDADERQEELIENGTVTAAVHVMRQNGETVVDTVRYGQQTTIESTQTASNEVQVTVSRAAERGTVVLTSVSEEMVGTLSDLSVTVDGNAAVRASSYSKLAAAVGGDQAKYVVSQQAAASARADVAVAVTHFSTRTITMSGGDGSGDAGGDSGDGGDSDGGDTTTTEAQSPGLGVLAALLALVAAALLARR